MSTGASDLPKKLYWLICLMFTLFLICILLLLSFYIETVVKFPSSNQQTVPGWEQGILYKLIKDRYYSVYDGEESPPPEYKINQESDIKPEIIIKVLCYDRLDSLYRSLQSLKEADYEQDQVPIEIFIDHIPKSENEQEYLTQKEFEDKLVNQMDHETFQQFMTFYEYNQNTNYPNWHFPFYHLLRDQQQHIQYTQRQVKISKSQLILYYVNQVFKWQHGKKNIHYRSQNAGLQGQWIEAWWPSSLNEFAYIVEDDVVVSPFWYRWIKKALLEYYYSPESRDEQIFGISTQKQDYAVGRDERGMVPAIRPKTRNKPFLYNSIGTWGQLLFPNHWIRFRLWYDFQKETLNPSPVIEGYGRSIVRSSIWYLDKKEKIWTPWFIKWLLKEKLYSVYPNFKTKKYLSASYQERGVSYSQTAGPNAELVMNATDLNLLFPRGRYLQRFDICMTRMPAGQIITYRPGVFDSPEFQRFLWDYAYLFKVLVVIRLDGFEYSQMPLLLNWLCHVQLQGLNRYVFITTDYKISLEMKKKGAGVFYIPVSGVQQRQESQELLFTNEQYSSDKDVQDLLSKQKDGFPADGLIQLQHFIYSDSKRKKKNFDLNDVISRLSDQLMHECLLYGYTFLMSDMHSLWKQNIIEYIIKYEHEQEFKSDLFIPELIYEQQSLLLNEKDNDRLLFSPSSLIVMKNNERTRLALELHLSKQPSNNEPYPLFINQYLKVKYNQTVVEESIHQSFSALKLGLISKLNIPSLKQFQFTPPPPPATQDDETSGMPPQIKLDKNAPIMILNEFVNMNSPLKEQIERVERVGLWEIEAKDFMCRRYACYSQNWRWRLEADFSQFEAS